MDQATSDDDRKVGFFRRVLGFRAGRPSLYVLLPVAYAVVLGGYYVVSGHLLQFFPVVFFLAAVPVTFVLGGTKSLLKGWAPILGIMVSYEALAGVLGSLSASSHVASLGGVELLLVGGNVPGWLQATFASTTLTQVATVFYALHMPLVVVTTLLLWYGRRALYGQYVTALAITSYVALVIFVLFPTAPPWASGFAANLLESGGKATSLASVGWLANLIEADKYAAFPSLHAAYAVLFCNFTIKTRKSLSVVAVPVTVGILFSTLYLGQHYVIDLVAGGGLALASCQIAKRYPAFGRAGAEPAAPAA